jgi:hypothetical protein
LRGGAQTSVLFTMFFMLSVLIAQFKLNAEGPRLASSFRR